MKWERIVYYLFVTSMDLCLNASKVVFRLVEGRSESSPAQYERNRRFGHLVHAIGLVALLRL